VVYPNKLSFLYIGKMDLSKHTKKKTRKHNAHERLSKKLLGDILAFKDKFKGEKETKKHIEDF